MLFYIILFILYIKDKAGVPHSLSICFLAGSNLPQPSFFLSLKYKNSLNVKKLLRPFKVPEMAAQAPRNT